MNKPMKENAGKYKCTFQLLSYVQLKYIYDGVGDNMQNVFLRVR